MATIRADKSKVVGRVKTEIRRIDARVQEIRALAAEWAHQRNRRWIVRNAWRYRSVPDAVAAARRHRDLRLRDLDDYYWNGYHELNGLRHRRSLLVRLLELCMYGDSTKVELTEIDVELLGFKVIDL